MFTDLYEKRLSWVDDIFRIRGPFKTRLNKLRLDKNEQLVKKYLKETNEGKKYLISELKILNINYLKSPFKNGL